MQPDVSDAILAQAEIDRDRLDSGAFGPVSLTALGIASVVGAGIFVTPARRPRSTPARP